MLVLDSSEDATAFQDTVEFEAAIFIDGREGIEIHLAISRRGRAEMRMIRNLDGGGSVGESFGERRTSEHRIHGGKEEALEH